MSILVAILCFIILCVLNALDIRSVNKVKPEDHMSPGIRKHCEELAAQGKLQDVEGFRRRCELEDRRVYKKRK